MASDVMSVRLHLPQICALGVVEDTPGALVVRVGRCRSPSLASLCRWRQARSTPSVQ